MSSMMKLSHFLATRYVFVFCLCLAIYFLACGSGYAMRTKNIPQEKLEQYETIARKYVEDSRGWKRNEYKFRFLWHDDALDMALFDAVNIESLEKTRKRQRELGPNYLMEDPTSFGIMVHTKELKAYEDSQDISSPWDETLWPEKYRELQTKTPLSLSVSP